MQVAVRVSQGESGARRRELDRSLLVLLGKGREGRCEGEVDSGDTRESPQADCAAKQTVSSFSREILAGDNNCYRAEARVSHATTCSEATAHAAGRVRLVTFYLTCESGCHVVAHSRDSNRMIFHNGLKDGNSKH